VKETVKAVEWNCSPAAGIRQSVRQEAGESVRRGTGDRERSGRSRRTERAGRRVRRRL